ncbi:unnamed protein product [Moneuplotes crassus]|uniref:Uncharacterized protein n=1 Tax=Euplotes crassus TaxID=5936 RepID=A0AAD1UIC6_EUPCR|nr:unnamed protein product [Moneuplotes crassus]
MKYPIISLISLLLIPISIARSNMITSKKNLSTYCNKLRNYWRNPKSKNPSLWMNQKINFHDNKDIANREDRIRYEENIHQESEDIDRQVLSSIEFKTLHRNLIKRGCFALSLDFNFDQHFKMLKSLDSLVLPSLRALEIENLNPRKPPALKRFLKNSFPRRVEELTLWSLRTSTINMDKYLKEILHASYKVQSKIAICCIDISQKALVRLFSACRNKEQVIFKECYFYVEKVPDFGHSLDGSTISSISFLSCRIYGQQGIRLSGFSNLVKGLSKSQDFKKSLKTILVSQSVPRRPYCNILSEFGFDKTSVRVIKY